MPEGKVLTKKRVIKTLKTSHEIASVRKEIKCLLKSLNMILSMSTYVHDYKEIREEKGLKIKTSLQECQKYDPLFVPTG